MPEISTLLPKSASSMTAELPAMPVSVSRNCPLPSETETIPRSAEISETVILTAFGASSAIDCPLAARVDCSMLKFPEIVVSAISRLAVSPSTPVMSTRTYGPAGIGVVAISAS